jgi:hypothetical protein
MGDGQQLLPRGRQRGRGTGVGVHDGTDIRPGRHHLGVNGEFGVAATLAVQHGSVAVDQQHTVGSDLVEPVGAGLHPHAATIGVTG